jgi:hypothetical protein
MRRTVAVCSLFKNRSRGIDYFRAALEAQAGPDLDLVFSFVEGDSQDDTHARLTDWAADDPRVRLQKIDVEPIRDFSERVAKWAELGNAAIEGLAGTHYDFLLWCESDLSIPPDLIAQLAADDVDIVAPAIFLGGLFYDTWGFRGLDGRKFANAAPHHPAYQPFGLVELASVGSTVLFKRAVIDSPVRLRGVHENGLLVGMCNDARSKGFRVFLDSRLAIVHPTSLWRAQQYEIGHVRAEGGAAGVPLELVSKKAPLLGSPELPPDHAVLADVRSIVETRLPKGTFALRTELHSESKKQYTLVIQEARCRPVSTR